MKPANRKSAEACRAARVQETGLPLVYLNQIGGQDELVFDGASFRAERAALAICAPRHGKKI